MPTNGVMKPGLRAVTLMEFIAATACGGEIRPSAAITKDENAKNTPATIPLPIDAIKTRPLARRVLSMSTSPYAARGGTLYVLAKITWRTTEGARDSVHHRSITSASTAPNRYRTRSITSCGTCACIKLP